MTQEEIKDKEIIPNEPFAIVSNTETGKWFRAKKCKTSMRYTNHSEDITFSVTPNDIKDTVPVIGAPRLPLSDWLLKKDLIGDNKKLHIEIFNADKVKQDEFFLYNAWISGIDSETNEIVLSCDWME